MAQVFLDLLGNAVRHSPSGGTVTIGARVETEAESNTLVNSVADEGAGIPEEELPYIWERFNKAD